MVLPGYTCAPWFRRGDYARWRQLDPALEEHYDAWLAKAEATMQAIARSGQIPQKVVIDPDDCLAWCLTQGRDVDADSRSVFAFVCADAQRDRD